MGNNKETVIGGNDTSININISNNSRCSNFYQVWNKTLFIFKDPNLRRSHTLACVVSFTLQYGFYGLTIWMPSFLDDIGTVNVYWSTLCTNVAQIPGTVLTAYLVDPNVNFQHLKSIDARILLALSMFGGSLSLIGLLFVKNARDIVILLCIFNGIVTICWTSSNVITTQLSPTNVKSTAIGIFTLFGRIGAIFANLTFGLFDSGDFGAPLSLSGLSFLVGTLACLMLPKTNNTKF